MRVAITGGFGFIGASLAARLVELEHEVVILGRRSSPLSMPPGMTFVQGGLEEEFLSRALAGCDACVHSAGINREIGAQTFASVHVGGTANVIASCRKVQVDKLVYLSFLRARPNCGSSYHESKWAAEELVRSSGLDFTVLRPGVVFGKGDHMVDHMVRAFLTFPVFGLIGCDDAVRLRPIALADMVRVIVAALLDAQLSRQTYSVVGPDDVSLAQAARLVAEALGRRPLFVPMPRLFLQIVASAAEATMKNPFLAKAQLAMLAEGLVESQPPFDQVPPEYLPATRFDLTQIRAAIANPSAYGLKDLLG